MEQIAELIDVGHYAGRIAIDPSVIRGLEYYTGPVFEAELTFEVKDEKGNPVRFGSVGGGGRYDDLVARFTGQKVPATGFSIGVSRLQAALAHLNKDKAPAADGPVVVTVMEKDRIADYQKLVQTLRNAGIRAELYLGNPKKFGKQLEYADKRGSPCVVIQGSNERDANPPQVILKDMIEGAKAAAAIADNKEWKETRPRRSPSRRRTSSPRCARSSPATLLSRALGRPQIDPPESMRLAPMMPAAASIAAASRHARIVSPRPTRRVASCAFSISASLRLTASKLL